MSTVRQDEVERKTDRVTDREQVETVASIPVVAKLMKLMNIAKTARFITSQPAGNMLTVVRD